MNFMLRSLSQRVMPTLLCAWPALFPSNAHAQSVVSLIRQLMQVPAPVMHTDTFALDPATPAATTTLTVSLTATPIPGMGAVVHFNSSQLGGDVFVTITQIQQSITITLPTYRPFTGADVVTVVYWSAK